MADLARSSIPFLKELALGVTRGLRCNEPSASRNLALGTTGIEVQGYLKTTQNERFNDASDFGTSHLLLAVGIRRRTQRWASALLARWCERRPFPQFFETNGRKTLPNLPETGSLRSRAGEAPEDALAGPCLT